jgi:hypothetical protein
MKRKGKGNEMKCFTHPQNDAVAQCSQCHKGTCSICAHDAEGATLCTSCYTAGLNAEIARAKRNSVGVWIFTGIITFISAIGAIGSTAQGGAAAILLIPLAFAVSWCLYWGCMPVWNGFRRTFAGWGCFGTWMFLLIITALIAEILVGIAVLVGAFTGIKKYNEARRIAANGSQMLADLQAMPMQQWSGPQGGSSL